MRLKVFPYRGYKCPIITALTQKMLHSWLYLSHFMPDWNKLVLLKKNLMNTLETKMQKRYWKATWFCIEKWNCWSISLVRWLNDLGFRESYGPGCCQLPSGVTTLPAIFWGTLEGQTGLHVTSVGPPKAYCTFGRILLLLVFTGRLQSEEFIG